MSSSVASFYHQLYPRISARLVLPFLLAIIAIAGIGVYTVTRLVAGSIQERFVNQLVDSANAAVNGIVEIERQHLAALRLMVFTSGVDSAIIAGDTTALDTRLRPVAANARIDRVIVFDVTQQSLLWLNRDTTQAGVAYTSAAPTPVELSSARRVLEAQSDALGDKFVDLVQEPEGWVLYFSAPVQNSAGARVGGVSVGILMERLTRQTSDQSLSAVALYNADAALLGSTFRAADPNELALAPQLRATLLASVEGGSPIRETTLNSVPYQILYSPFKVRSQTVGLLAVGLPSNFIVERSGTSRDTLSLIFSVLFVVVGVLGLLVSRSITRPVSRLVDTTRAIRSGDLSQRVGLRMPDELGELGLSFDHMTDQLVRRNRQVQRLYMQQVEETARREAVLASIADAVLVLDTGAHVLLQNRAAETLVQQAEGDPQWQETLDEIFAQPQALATPRMIEIADRFYSVLSTPVIMPSGHRLGFVVVFRDFTALVLSERLKDELILQMSHELRTPLAAVRGYVDLLTMLEATRISEQGKDFLSKASEQLLTLERSTNQVIDVSSIITGKFELNRMEFDLVAVLRERVAHWKPHMQSRDLTFEASASDESLLLNGDPVRISEVLDHLLRNAYSYTMRGGVTGIRVSREANRLMIGVYDTGVGIAPDEMERVFDRMYRGQAADAGPTDSRGMGLGLYLAKTIIEAHGGTIKIESRLNVGTAVIVELPAH